MKVLIIDSSVLIIERIQQLLSDTEHITEVHGAVSYRDGLRHFNLVKPEIVVLDMNLPANESSKLLEEIKAFEPACRVVALSMKLENGLLEGDRNAVTDFFFDKYEEFEKIPSAIDSLIDKINKENN